MDVIAFTDEGTFNATLNDDDSVTLGEEIELPPECPMCGGPGGLLGSLGRLTWFRCVNCGIDFNEGGNDERNEA